MTMTVSKNLIRVWDLPTRLFHWALAGAVLGSFISVKIGGNAMIWHGRFGYAVLTLLLFRLVWGFIGPRYARFSGFIRGPAAIVREIRGGHLRAPGHSPLGAVSVIALIMSLGVQATLGLFSTDEIAFDGPLAKHVSNDWVAIATRLHQASEWLLLGLIALHIAAIIFYYRVKKRDLVQPMLTGDQSLADFSAQSGTENWPASRDDAGLRAKAILVITLAAMVVAYLSR
jgi:cytochrome b